MKSRRYFRRNVASALPMVITFPPPDLTPDDVVFIGATGANPSTAVTSNVVTVSGLNQSVTVTPTGCTVSKNGGAYGASATVVNGDTLQLKATSSATGSGNIVVSVQVGTATFLWSITTVAAGFPLLSPGAGWTGVATTTGLPATPASGTRTPGADILTPGCKVPGSSYVISPVDEVVGIHAYAAMPNGNPIPMSSLVVKAYCEGNVVTVPFGTYSYNDANGNARTIWGYFIRLKHAQFAQDGFFNVKWEIDATAADVTQAKATVGPLQYYRNSANGNATGAYDFEYTVKPSQAASGNQFQTLIAALLAVRSANAKNPRITLMESGNYEVAANISGYFPVGYVTIDAAPGVLANLTDVNSWNVRTYGMRLKGAGVRIDASLGVITTNGGVNNLQGWILDGCDLFSSFGRDSTLEVRRNINLSTTTYPLAGNIGPLYMLDDTRIHDMVRGQIAGTNYLNRNIRLFNLGFDSIRGKNTYGLTDRNHSESWYMNEATTKAFSLTYTGAAAQATYETTTGVGNGANHLLLKENGTTVLDVTLYPGGATYKTMQQVVDEINAIAGTHPGWSATFIDNHMDAQNLATSAAQASSNAASGALSCKNATVYLYGMTTDHGDAFQADVGGGTPADTFLAVNVDIQTSSSDSTADTQHLLLKDIAYMHNAFLINFAAGGTTTATGSPTLAQIVEPCINAHLWHCTFADQVFAMRSSIDASSSFKGCVLRGFNLDPSLGALPVQVDSNFIGSYAPGAGSSAVITNPLNAGSTIAQLITNQTAADFSPKAGGGLATINSLVPFDLFNNPRGGTSHIGAVA